jgi:hypothetical protein
MRAFPLLVGIVCALPFGARSAESPAQMAFEQFKTLTGSWRSTDPENKTTVEIKLVANGSTLVETWRYALLPTRQRTTSGLQENKQFRRTPIRVL